MQNPPPELNALTAELNLITAIITLLAASVGLGFAIDKVLKRIRDKRKVFQRVRLVGQSILWVTGCALFPFRTQDAGLVLIFLSVALFSLDYCFGEDPACRAETFMLVFYFSASILFVGVHFYNVLLNFDASFVRLIGGNARDIGGIVKFLRGLPHANH